MPVNPPIMGYSDVNREGPDNMVSHYQRSRLSLLNRPRGLCAARAVASKCAITLFLFIIRPILSLKGLQDIFYLSIFLSQSLFVSLSVSLSLSLSLCIFSSVSLHLFFSLSLTLTVFHWWVRFRPSTPQPSCEGVV